jgi:hypothetical protein
MASSKRRATIEVECNSSFTIEVNGVKRSYPVVVSADVDADVIPASFKGNRYEPADPPEIKVTGAEVEITFDDSNVVEGNIILRGDAGLDAFHQFWYVEDIFNEAVDSAEDDDDADYQYETQRELRDEYGPYGGDEQC